MWFIKKNKWLFVFISFIVFFFLCYTFYSVNGYIEGLESVCIENDYTRGKTLPANTTCEYFELALIVTSILNEQSWTDKTFLNRLRQVYNSIPSDQLNLKKDKGLYRNGILKCQNVSCMGNMLSPIYSLLDEETRDKLKKVTEPRPIAPSQQQLQKAQAIQQKKAPAPQKAPAQQTTAQQQIAQQQLLKTQQQQKNAQAIQQKNAQAIQQKNAPAPQKAPSTAQQQIVLQQQQQIELQRQKKAQAIKNAQTKK